jgi:eukaryotic-like serine/threonine-protein kinase
LGGLVQVNPEQWPSVSRLLDAALDIPPADREQWLESLPPSDLQFEATLRTLLRHAGTAETREFLDIFPSLPMGAVPAIRHLAAGDTVGPYAIEEEIGRGGMGAVWRARRSDGVIKRPVALKLPHAGPHGRHLIERFMFERDILAELAHPNIARLYDAGFTASGQPFLALEYVAGAHLTDYCERHGLDRSRRLRLFQQVLRAIQYAHGHLVIHGDIKPSNVIVGVDGRAMLLDFGVAKVIAAETADQRAPQRDIALTPYYASPEQIAGESITTASDVYSLGVLLRELLTGERPRGGLSRILDGDLNAIVAKALSSAPGERYVTADAFWQDVEHYLRGEPVSARAGGSWYRTRKFVTRYKAPVAAGSVALIATLATAAIALFEAHTAALERDRALAMSSRSEAVAEFLNVLITEAGAAEKPVTVGDMLARSEALLDSQYRNNPEQRAAVLDMLAVYYQNTGHESARSEQLLSEALSAVKFSRDGDLRRKLMCDHAMAVQTLDRFQVATRALNAVIDDPQTSPQQAAECLESLAYVSEEGGDEPGALRAANRALERLQDVPNASPMVAASVLATAGFAQHLNGHNDVAEQLFARSLTQFAHAGRDRGPEAIAVRNDWAVVSQQAGNPRRALEQYDQSLRMAAENNPASPPPPYLLANRARALRSLGRFGAARESYVRCTDQTRRSGESTGLASCLLGLAGVAYETGELQAADDWLDQAAAVIGTVVPPGSHTALSLQVGRGTVAVAQGRRQQARALLDAVVEKGTNAELSIALQSRAELNLNEQRLGDGEADARRLLSITQAAQGGIRYSDRTGLAWLALGRVLAQRGDALRAKDAFDAAVAHLSNTVDEDHPMLVRARQLAHG